MQRPTVFALVIAFVGGAILLLSGCESTGTHRMANRQDGHVMACQKCYDEVKTVQWDSGKDIRFQFIRKHMCPDCNIEVTIYAQDGKPMIKCSKCAPEGVSCDKCLPPKTKS